MADAIGSLVVSLQADIARFDADLKRATTLATDSAKRVETSLASMQRTADAVGQSVERSTASFSGLARAAAGFVVIKQAFDGLTAISRMTDELTALQSRLQLVTTSASNLASVQERLFAISQAARVPFANLAETYSRLATSAGQMGISQERILGLTRTISQAMTIGGGSTESMRAALVQFSQGLASGVLRGEELNSVMEQTPRLARAIAEGLGITVGELRKLGAEGAITTTALIGALEKVAPLIQQEFAKTIPTIGASFQQLRDAWALFLSEFDKGAGASASLASSVSGLASALGSLSQEARGIGETLKPLIDVAAWTAFGLAASSALAFIVDKLKYLRALSANPIVITVTLAAAAVATASEIADAYKRSETGARNMLESARSELELRRRMRAEVEAENAANPNARNNEAVLRNRAEEARLVEKVRAAEEALYEIQAKRPANPVEQARRQMREGEIRLINEQALQEEALTGAVLRADEAYAKATQGLKTAATIEREYQNDLKATQRAYQDRVQAMVAAGATEAQLMRAAREQDDWERRRAQERDKQIAALDGGGASNYARELARMQEQATTELARTNQFYAEMARLITAARTEQEALTVSTVAWSEEVARLGAAAGAELDKRRGIQTAQDSALRSIEQQNMVLGAQLATLTLTERERQKILATIEYEIALQNLGKNATEQQLEALKEQLRLRLKLVDAQNDIKDQDAATAAARKAMEEAQRGAEKMQESITDALMRAFSSGEDFARNLRDEVMRMFNTMVLRPVIQAIVGSVMGGAPGMAMAGGGMGGMGGMGNMAMAAGGGNWMSTAMFGSGGFGGFMSGTGGVFAPGALLEGFATSSFGQAIGLSTLAEFSTGAAAIGSLGIAIGTILPIAALILGALAMAGVFDSEPSQVQGTYGIRKTGNASQFEGGKGGIRTFMGLDFGFLDENTKQFSGSAGRALTDIIVNSLTGAMMQMTSDQRDQLKNALSEMVFDEQQGEFTTENFLKTYGLPTYKKAVQAAFDILDPELADLFRNFEGTLEETEAYATKLLQINAILHSADIALQSIFGGLSAQDVLDFADLFGGSVENMVNSVEFFVAQFAPTSYKLTRSTNALTAAFAAAGVEVPASREAFWDMVMSIGTATESSRELTAAMLRLAPATDAYFDLLEDASRRRLNFALSLLTPTQLGEYHTANANNVLKKLGWDPDMTKDQFLAKVGGLVMSNPDDYAQWELIDQNGDSFRYVYGQATEATSALTTFGDRMQSIIDIGRGIGQGRVSASFSSIESLYDNIGQQLLAKVRWISNEIRRLSLSDNPLDQGMLIELQSASSDVFKSLGRWNTLVAMVGEDLAGTLFDDYNEFLDLKELFANFPDDLALITRNWEKAIEDATKQSETLKLNERIALGEWLASLFSDPSLSPLSPADQLAAAKQSYLAAIESGEGIQGAAQNYLSMARAYYGSSAGYGAIFSDVVSQVGSIFGDGMEDIPDTLQEILAVLAQIREAIEDGTTATVAATTSAANTATFERVTAIAFTPRT